MIGSEEAQAGEQVAEGFLVEKAVVAGDAWAAGGAGAVAGGFGGSGLFAIELSQQEAVVFTHALEEAHMGDVAEQRLLSVLLNFAGVVEHMIDTIAQKAGADAGGSAEQKRLHQSPAQVRLLRVGHHVGWRNHLPRCGVLGLLQLEGGAGAEEIHQVVLRHCEALAQLFVLFDQARLKLELAFDAIDLLAKRLGAGGVEREGGIHGLQLLVAPLLGQAVAQGHQRLNPW